MDIQATSRSAAPPRGHADGFIGSYATGWALSPDERSCRVMICGADGTTLGSGIASRHRPDLAVLGGRIDVGFRILVPDLAGNTLLHVHADGVELPNSPLLVGPDMFDGDLVVRGDIAAGWVRARTPEPACPLVTLHAEDGTSIGSARSIYVVDDNDPDSSRALFSIPIADAMFGIGEFALTARANGRPFACALGNLALDGYLDLVDANLCAGWLVCPAAPQRHLHLEVLRDGIVAGRGQCKDARPDLREHYPQGWNNGFSIPIKPPETEPSSGLHVFSIRTEGGRMELLGGPRLLGSRFDFIAVTRGLHRLAHPAAATPHGRGLLSDPERAVFRDMLHRHLADLRRGPHACAIPAFTTGACRTDRPVDVLIPIYKGVEVTEICIRSVLDAVRPADRLILVVDCPPEVAMKAMLVGFRAYDNIVLLNNDTNLGFVGSVNRGLAYSRDRDVLLLNSDTRLFPGGIDEMCSILHGADDIGTVTALSNNATIFSYPHPTLPTERLGDMGWDEVADVARETGAGRTVDVPTGHGFCMLVRRELLDRVGGLDAAFGRGYGEENELCMRASDLGFRHVAALGVFVEHRESVSFGDGKDALLKENLPKLEGRYPEYTPMIMRFEAVDPLRTARWAIDAARLRAARDAGTRFVLIVLNWLGGGTRRAVADIGDAVGYSDCIEIHLHNTRGGAVELDCCHLRLKSVFLDEDGEELVRILDAAGIDLVVIHQLLGFGPGIVQALGRWSGQRHSVAYLHDFYSICPRVTLIDAVDRYCGVQPVDVCDRCIAMGGRHEASRLGRLTAMEHRALFHRILSGMRAVVAPSTDAARHLGLAYPDLPVRVIPHPEPPGSVVPSGRPRDPGAIALLGGIGPHKGADKLLELARMAALSHPGLHFHVIGHSSQDDALEKLANVSITGRYEPHELPGLIVASRATIALFLHVWPETYSYTLSEAVAAGLLPVVPDIGAPAERVRASGWGRIFPFPIVPQEVLALLDDIGESVGTEAPPFSAFDTSGSIPLLRDLFAIPHAIPPGADSLPAMRTPVGIGFVHLAPTNPPDIGAGSGEMLDAFPAAMVQERRDRQDTAC